MIRVEDLDAAVTGWTRQVVTGKLAAERTLRGVCNAATACNAVSQTIVAHFAPQLPEDPPLACRKGCGHCCDAVIRTRPLEAIFAAVHATLTLSSEEQRAVGARLNAGRTPCPLLDDAGNCRIYEARMTVCRQYYSFDYQRCLQQDFGRQITDLVTSRANLRLVIHRFAQKGTSLACRDLGLQDGSVHIDTVLRILTDDPQALDRWLAGESVFPLLPEPDL